MILGRRELLVLAAGVGAACKEPEANQASPVSLHGAGATFPFPLYSKWIDEYNELYPNVRIDYQPIGSGSGIRKLIAGAADFGATDAPMKADESKQGPGAFFHIPTAIGAVVVSYHVPGIAGALKLSPEALSAIYLGAIKKWNDPKILADNPDARLPDEEIAVVYRTDGSGTTAVFTDYLAAVSREWKEKVGTGRSVKWPVGSGAKGNEGVTGQVKTTPFSIGYIERAYATQAKLPMAELENKAGKFVAPTTSALSAAAESIAMPAELVVSLVDSAAEAAYPITGYTYLLLHADGEDSAKGEAIAKYSWWALHDGQKIAESLDYAPLPAKVVTLVEACLKKLSAEGKALL